MWRQWSRQGLLLASLLQGVQCDYHLHGREGTQLPRGLLKHLSIASGAKGKWDEVTVKFVSVL